MIAEAWAFSEGERGAHAHNLRPNKKLSNNPDWPGFTKLYLYV